jgi:hypothetical protein
MAATGTFISNREDWCRPEGSNERAGNKHGRIILILKPITIMPAMAAILFLLTQDCSLSKAQQSSDSNKPGEVPISVPTIPGTNGQRYMFSTSSMYPTGNLVKATDIAILTSTELKASNFQSVTEVDSDFDAAVGCAYIVNRWGVTCTLPSAIGAYGKEILVQNRSVEKHSGMWFSQPFRASKGQLIFVYDAGSWMDLDTYDKKWQRYHSGNGLIGSGRFISVGKNWYLVWY